MTDRTIEQLAHRLLALEEAAYEELLDRFETPIYRFFFYAVRNEEQAMDMSNQTFSEFTCAVKGGTFRSPDRLAGFVFGIARNVLNRYLRGKQRNRVVHCDQLDQQPYKQAGGAEQSQTREILQRVFCLIDRFKEPERQVMLLRFVEGLATKEIAEVLEIPINSVKSCIHRSRQQLTSIMGEFPGDIR